MFVGFNDTKWILKWLFLRDKNTQSNKWLKCLILKNIIIKILYNIYIYIYILLPSDIMCQCRNHILMQSSGWAIKNSLDNFLWLRTKQRFLIWGNMIYFALVAVSEKNNLQATFQPLLLLWIIIEWLLCFVSKINYNVIKK